MKSRYNYTFNDILNLLLNDNFEPWSDTGSSIFEALLEDTILSSSVIASFSEIGALSGGQYTFAPYITKILDNIYHLHNENYCVFVDLETMSGSEGKRFILKFLTLLNQTAPKYKELLKYYDDLKTKLLDRLKTISSGVARYNDTPQNSGDFSDDSHTTNISSTSGETEIEVKTPIERLKEIQDSYSQVIARWSEEFDNLFVEEANFDD